MSTITNPTIHADAVPLRVDENGDIRVADSRLLLDVIISEYEKGTPAEIIAREYDAVGPADIYGAIAYYLRHRDEVTAYIRRRERAAEELERKIKAEMPLPPGFKEKWRALRAEREQEQHHAPPG